MGLRFGVLVFRGFVFGVVGFRVSSSRIPRFGFSVSRFRCSGFRGWAFQVQVFGFGVSRCGVLGFDGSGFWDFTVQGFWYGVSRFRVWGSGFHGLVFRVRVFGLVVWVLRFGVGGLDLRIGVSVFCGTRFGVSRAVFGVSGCRV